MTASATGNSRADLLPASPEWTHGTAAKFPRNVEQRERIEAFNAKMGETLLDPDELYLHRMETPSGYKSEPRPAYYCIVGHIVERDA